MFQTTNLSGFGAGAAGGGITPLGVTSANLVHWVRGDSTTADPLTAWPDQSGNGFTLSSVTGTPDLLSATINGHNAVDFNSSDVLWDPTARTSRVSGSLMLIIRPDSYASGSYEEVVRVDNGGSGGATPKIVQGYNADNFEYYSSDGGNKYVHPPNRPTATNWGKFFCYGDSGTELGAAWGDDAFTTTVVGTLVAGDGLAIGGGTGSDAWGLGAIAEVAAWDAVLSVADWAAMRTYANDRYGL